MALITPTWLAQLQPASYNGIPFFVEETEYSTGRRVAIHLYPYRDNPFCEDMGLAQRQIRFQAFLVGDDVYAQRDALKRACETKGNGKLIHPSIGNLDAALVAAGFREDKDRGGSVEVSLTFVVVDEKPRWPTATADTQTVITTATTDVTAASQGDFFSQVNSALQQGTTAVQGAVNEVQGVLNTTQLFVNTALQPLRDAGGIVNSVAGLGQITAGFGGVSLGRYIGNPLSTLSNAINQPLNVLNRGLGAVTSVNLGVSSLMTSLTVARTRAETSFASMTTFAANL